MPRRLGRRTFLGKAGLGVAGAFAVASRSPALGFTANETVRAGCIGTGGRALRALMPSLRQVPNVEIRAVSDVWDRHLEEAKALAEAGSPASKDYRRVLDRRDVDAVLVATPDHWHVPITVDACKAGKDVYVEKPLTHDSAEGDRVIAAQNESSRIVQVGMQQRSMPHIRKARELVRQGRIGDVHRIHLSWNRGTSLSNRRPRYGIEESSVDWKAFLGSAPAREFDEYRFRNWRWFWDYGGGILTDLMVHWIDVANWICDLDGPARAASIGDHYQTKGLWETPDTIQTLLEYPDRGVQVFFEGTFFNARNGARIELQGTGGTLYIDRGRYELIPQGGGEADEWVIGSGGRGADFYGEVNGALLHLTDWIECVRSRKAPVAPAEAGVSACRGAHLGNEAFRSGKVALARA